MRSLELSDERMGAEWRKANPEAFAKVREMMALRSAAGEGEPGREAGARAQMGARRHHDVFDRLPRAKMPTLVCAGRYDGIAPVPNSAAIVDQMPDATLDVFDGGHMFMVQDRRANQAIVDFFQAG